MVMTERSHMLLRQLQMKAVVGSVMIVAMLSAGVLVPPRAWGQASSEHLQHVEKQLAKKQAAAEAHREQMDQMMKRIGEHSTYMETVQDQAMFQQAMFQQEMLRHQKMLDQMMQLMQR
jgi:septal ring factor EnvC (AmiA/AmiB activator)